MVFLNNKLLQDHHDRCAREIPSDPYAGAKTIGALDVLRAHYLIVDYFLEEGGEGIGGVGPRDLNLLFSTLGRQDSRYGAVVKWTEDLDLIATLFYGLVKNHVFYDANKRTAFLSLLLHLWKNNRVPEAPHNDFENLALRVAANSLSEYVEFEHFVGKEDAEVRFISRFLRKKTRKTDQKQYFITYHDLNRILQSFGFWLANPSNNRIEVWEGTEERVWTLLGPRKKKFERRVGVIDFPGWTRQMAKNDIREVRRITGLDEQNKIDSEVFFRGATPLASYIEQYETLLKRLADR